MYSSCGMRSDTTLQGVPTAMVFSGMSFNTKLCAPIQANCPMFTPMPTYESAPMKARAPITMRSHSYSNPRLRTL